MSETIDSVTQIQDTPPIVHICDIHGYLEDARSALLAVGETDRYDPVVTADETGEIHWADNDYVLLINGDLIDRGPANDACMEMIWRLFDEAPAGRVRYHVGNHEMAILVPSIFCWPDTYSTGLADSQRRAFLQRVVGGDVTAAFEGYNYTYSHAGSNDAIDTMTVNAALREAASTLIHDVGERNESQTHDRIVEQYGRLFDVGENSARGPSAGLWWLDFKHLEETAPPQVVGHSMRKRPVRKGNVVCGNIIRRNQGSKGGEGVLIEAPDELTFVRRDRGGTVGTTTV
jgi:hypothetical protein